MNVNDLNLDSYSSNMEDFLLRLRREAEEISQQFESGISSAENLDRYLLEVNSFYYRSFHETFWPIYKKDIRDDINQLLDLKVQEDLLKKHIAAIIKRHANLFNQVKNTSTRLQQLKLHIMDQRTSFSDERDRQVLELIYGFNEIRAKLWALEEFIGSLDEISSGLTVLNGQSGSQMLIMGAQSLCYSDLEDPMIYNSYYRLIKQQGYIFDLIQKCASDNNIMPERISKIRSLLVNSSIELPADFCSFYEVQIQSTSLRFAELMLLNLQVQDHQRLQEIILEFLEFFTVWLSFLNLIMSYISKPGFKLIPELCRLNLKHPGYLKELHYDVSSTRKNVEEVGKDMDDTKNIDFLYLSTQIKNILEFSAPLYKTMAHESPVSEISLLTARIQQISLAFSVLDSRIRILAEEHMHTASIISHSDDLLTWLNSELELLSNIKNDLERLLAPRNIARVWKDLDIRVTHIPLTRGKTLPDEYLYLLDKYHINTRITEQMDHTVLHEEGDIFIIRVEDESSEEIPYMIIGKKG